MNIAGTEDLSGRHEQLSSGDSALLVSNGLHGIKSQETELSIFISFLALYLKMRMLL
jgi:hypothetical protein